jgi:hypothetical protein
VKIFLGASKIGRTIVNTANINHWASMCPLGSLKAQSKLKIINFVSADYLLYFSMMASGHP